MTTEIQNRIEDLFHFSEMSQDEKAIFLADLGGLIMESSVTRFIAESDEASGTEFTRVLGMYADKDDLHVILSDMFPLFKAILEEETQSFREDAERVLGNSQ